MVDKNIKKIARVIRNKKIYEKNISILDNLKKQQDQIINKFIKKKENEEIEKIRKKLNN